MMMGMPGMGGMPGTPMYISDNFSLYAGAYFSYTRGKSVRIKCLFDQNFEHIDGPVEESVFDKIKKFIEKLKNNDTAENVFKWNDHAYYGYYYKNNDSYRIREF
tara:strand:+ start:83 stop:394 length:312 start_codon:yes stop_codon:yes gene_type:complete